MNVELHAHTPLLIAVDSRGLKVRSIAFYRAGHYQPADERVVDQTYDGAGRLVSQCDPRLSHPNLTTTYSLSGQPLLIDSVDSGWRLGLLGEAGQVVEGWDTRGIHRQVEYDTHLRPIGIHEQGLVCERLTYGGLGDFERNRCNRPIRHDDPAGSQYLSEYGVLGSVLIQARRFLLAAETPDWPPAEAKRDVLLENFQLETHRTFNALGETIRQTDALGSVQHFTHTPTGQQKTIQLTMPGAGYAQPLVSEIRYNAFDQVEQETAGNGVVIRSRYDPQDGRLMERNAGLDGKAALLHLTYGYDPVGNILHIEDTAQPVRFFSNQRVEPVSRYSYDTLYQLIEATGREVNTGASHGPALPALQNLPPDANRVGNYTQHYDYDTGGNLLQMRHVGAHSFTRTLRVAPDSNRSLPEGEVEVDFDEAFDANGNLLHLVRGQTLDWDPRNQLRQITTVTRDDSASDCERYVYDGQGQRCRKINSAQTSSRTLNNEVRYLPGLEIRTTADGEILHVITAHNARVLHWQAGLPSGIENDQIRYSLNDQLGSSTLELDQLGGLISQESYYPFGGTAWWAARSTADAKYKTIRYSGKERDASGLYYYGFRYYAPWLQRWINPDPAGDVDGLNLYRFSRNCPISLMDPSGASPFNFNDVLDELDKSGDPVEAIGLENVARWNPAFGGTLAVALSASRKGLAFARATINREMFSSTNPIHRETLLRHFRTESEASHDNDIRILGFLGQQIGKLSSFLQNWDSARMVGVGGDRESSQVAWQYTHDPDKHLFLRNGVVHESAHHTAWNIIHESSHIALGTSDFWYIRIPGATPAKAEGLASYSGRIQFLSDLQRQQFRHATMIWDGPDKEDFDSAAFKNDPFQRSQVILKNADSIALLVSSINEKFAGPMANITVLNEQPSIVPALTIPSACLRRHESRRLSL
ncbi:RHS repeat protein [Pseudomonas sp. R1-18]|uniref:RHS repeat domain-containing protein n=1 Tax=Pseudomonas sp. R1-18 TaxID=1632772 RepID=UPI003DAA05A6